MNRIDYDLPIMAKAFGPDEVVDVTTNRYWWMCHFDDCEIVSESADEQVFWRCSFHGRASEWLKRQLSKESGA